MKLLMKTIPPSGKTHSGTVIFFHGSGDTGSNLIEWIRFLLGKDLQFPHLKLIFPTAPLQPYTPLGGQMSNVWFDRKSISIEARECRKSLASMYEIVNDLVDSEINAGIPLNRIVVGGFSMGGALALHTAFHLNTDLAGIFTCSSFLNRGSIVYESLKHRKNPQAALPKLIMFHGDRDTLVPLHWGQETFNELTNLGIRGKFVSLNNTLHELKKVELIELEDWINEVLPPLSSDLQNKL